MRNGNLKKHYSAKELLDLSLSCLPNSVQGIIYQAKKNGWVTQIKGLFLRHSDQPFCYEGIIQEPSICIVLSGEREVQLGEQCYRFDNQHSGRAAVARRGFCV